jgi:hypothetical protein
VLFSSKPVTFAGFHRFNSRETYKKRNRIQSFIVYYSMTLEIKIQKIICKHYLPKNQRFKTRGWEQCGIEIQNLIRDKEDKIRSESSSGEYSEMCDKIDKMRREIESIYESYFSIGSGYDWINGNKYLKELIN